MTKDFLFTSESVTEGHPDKVCDQISDAFLDEFLKQDAESRVAVETLVTTELVVVAGEVRSNANFDKKEQEELVRKVIREIGYNDPDLKFSAESCKVTLALHAQSSDISQGVTPTAEKEQGAGDQGLMFGFASNETEELMPLAILLAHKLTKKLANIRKSKELSWVRPDGKSQVSVRYEDGRPTKIEAVVISTQHATEVTNEEIKKSIIEKVIKPTLGKYWNEQIKIHINPTGRFVIGGPEGDAGLTGRKIIVDTYGGFGRHGGGAFSGKDPSKVDRSACYMCRYIAKNIVAAGLADKCEVQVAYAIGIANPISLMVNTFDTNKIPEKHIEEIVKEYFDMRPSAIISQLELKRPIYQKTASYGHFGKDDPDFKWEQTDKAETLRQAAGL
jgi:S-adenosylmethionine synthetase